MKEITIFRLTVHPAERQFHLGHVRVMRMKNAGKLPDEALVIIHRSAVQTVVSTDCFTLRLKAKPFSEDASL